MTETTRLQIINDVAEDMNYSRHTKAQYREIIRWLAKQECLLQGEIQTLKMQNRTLAMHTLLRDGE